MEDWESRIDAFSIKKVMGTVTDIDESVIEI
jgi:hypothetical protein